MYVWKPLLSSVRCTGFAKSVFPVMWHEPLHVVAEASVAGTHTATSRIAKSAPRLARRTVPILKDLDATGSPVSPASWRSHGTPACQNRTVAGRLRRAAIGALWGAGAAGALGWRRLFRAPL